MEHRLVERKKCVVCGSEHSTKVLDCPDFLISNDPFPIYKCDNCSFEWTGKVPVEEEVYKYYKSDAYISHSNSSKGLFNKVYQTVRVYALSKKAALVARLIGRSGKVLDYGAGTGHFAALLDKEGYDVTGLEIDPDAREIALKEVGFQLEDISKLNSIDDDSLDAVTMWHVLEHVYHLQEYLHNVTSKIKKGGKYVIAVPNHTSYDAKYYGKNWAAYDVPRHLYHFSPTSISNLLEKYNFEMESVLPMVFDSYYVSMLSEELQGKNKWKGLLTGLKSNLKAKEGSYSSQIYVFNKKN